MTAKILIVTDWAPPYNRIGAIRVGRIVKYLMALGYEIRIITSHHNKETDLSVPINLPTESIIYTNELRFSEAMDVNYYAMPFYKKIYARLRTAIKFKSIWHLFREDSLPWMRPALRESQKIIDWWHPDLIFSSALPITAHIIASRLSLKNKIPWVAEYRDLWLRTETPSRNHFFNYFHNALERYIISNANLLVTVSVPLAVFLKNQYQKEVVTIYNGFDFLYKPKQMPSKICNNPKLKIVHTGSVLLSGRAICNPIPLFQALRLLTKNRTNISIQIYTDKNVALEQMITDFKVADVVTVHDRISYMESIKKQQEADVLLFFGYLTEVGSKSGIVSGKVFEYLGARKPILSIGSDHEHVLCREGLMENFDNPIEIAKKLTAWITEKRSSYSIECPFELEKIIKWSAKYQTEVLSKSMAHLFK
jgi:glycosyltransferase involved in cell wall biosynthesis